MPPPTPSSASAATLVARAADEYLERLAAGESPDVAEFVRRYPQVAGVLPQVLPALGLLKALAPAGARAGGPGRVPHRPRDRPGRDGASSTRPSRSRWAVASR